MKCSAGRKCHGVKTSPKSLVNGKRSDRASAQNVQIYDFLRPMGRKSSDIKGVKTATIALIDARTQAPGILGTLIGTYPTMEAAFAADATFQSQNPTPYVPTKVVTLKEPLSVGTPIEPQHLLAYGDMRCSRARLTLGVVNSAFLSSLHISPSTHVIAAAGPPKKSRFHFHFDSDFVVHRPHNYAN